MSLISFFKKYNVHKFLALIYFYLNKYSFLKIKSIQFKPEENKTINLIKRKGVNNSDIPKNIWMYWHDEESADLKIFPDHIRKKNPEWNLIVVSKNTLKNYVPDLCIENLDMPLANITDLIRLELLYKYGGVWLDYTILLNEKIEYFLKIDNISQYDVIAYYREVSTKDFRFPAMESWFLAAPKNSFFIEKCLLEFNEVKEIGSLNFYTKLTNRSDYLDIVQKIDVPEYLIVYLVFQIVMRSYEVNCYLRLSDSSAFLVQDSLGWRSHKSTVAFFINSAPEKISPIYKLTSGDRQYFDILKKYNFVNSESIFGRILKSLAD